MKITEISAGWAETISLPEYSNAKPSLRLTAVLEDGDDPDEAVALLLREARDTVREKVDRILEAHNRPPKYYGGPRFQVLYSRETESVVVMRDDTNDWPGGYTHTYKIPRGIRYEVALAKASDYAEEMGYIAYDCSDGDFSELPQPEENNEVVQEVPF